jgi:hypothetical protein
MVFGRSDDKFHRGRRLEASDFDILLSSDPVRDILDWLNQPDGVQERWGRERWEAFCARCQSDYGFHPQTDGALTAAELSQRAPGRPPGTRSGRGSPKRPGSIRTTPRTTMGTRGPR